MTNFNSVSHQKGHQAHFTAALLKVVSRCNLNCDYCYVYHHADQTWKLQPKFMDDTVIQLFAKQLSDYITKYKIPHFSIIFHGGEPLLYSAERLALATRTIKQEIQTTCDLDFSVQTNGVLLTDEALRIFEEEDIVISLSLDGPQYANDLHRLDHAGNSSFHEAMAALQKLLATKSDIFQGVIAVIDPKISPQELFSFFYPMNLPRLDLLLPDATHARPPLNKTSENKLYIDWLIEAFELWFENYSDLSVRFFDAVLGTRLNIPSPTDALGFGQVSLLVIETDGSYTDHDVFKITKQNANDLRHDLSTATFEQIAGHPKILEHNFRLTPEGIAQECKVCPVMEACGGGAVMHRYHPTRGLDAPTVYCEEMFSLLSKATFLLRESLTPAIELTTLPNFSLISFSHNLIEECQIWREQTENLATDLANSLGIDKNGASAASLILYNELLKDQETIEKPEIYNELSPYIWLDSVRIQSNDHGLIAPFSKSIRLISTDSEKYAHGISMFNFIEQYLAVVSSSLPLAISTLISDIVFVESTIEYETGIFSFSDDSAPNVIYLDPFVGNTPLAPDDLADSILHEFLHHVLYHIEMTEALLYDYDFPRFPAPWRSGLRPAGGFLHGTFVFSGLARFWKSISETQADLPLFDRAKAQANAASFREKAIYGINSTYEFALLTPHGRDFVERIARQLNVQISKMQPPGLILTT